MALPWTAIIRQTLPGAISEIAGSQDGAVLVSVIDPRAMFKLIGNPELDTVAEEVASMLKACLDEI